MLIVLADERDAAARRLVEHWRGHGARLMHARDLGSPGWCHGAPGAGESRAAIGGAIVPYCEIAGVVTRIPCVRPVDLPQIAEADREYVAAEYTAFLTAWLDGLRCPVVNRPSAASLLGPVLSQERWLLRAARAGITLSAARYAVPDPVRPLAEAAVTVVGERWFGRVASELGIQAVRLARHAGVELMTALFSAPRPDAVFVGVDLMIDVTPEIADALLARLAQLAEEVRP
jgi:hypothetical protein